MYNVLPVLRRMPIAMRSCIREAGKNAFHHKFIRDHFRCVQRGIRLDGEAGTLETKPQMGESVAETEPHFQVELQRRPNDENTNHKSGLATLNCRE